MNKEKAKELIFGWRGKTEIFRFRLVLSPDESIYHVDPDDIKLFSLNMDLELSECTACEFYSSVSRLKYSSTSINLISQFLNINFELISRHCVAGKKSSKSDQFRVKMFKQSMVDFETIKILEFDHSFNLWLDNDSPKPSEIYCYLINCKNTIPIIKFYQSTDLFKYDSIEDLLGIGNSCFSSVPLKVQETVKKIVDPFVDIKCKLDKNDIREEN